MQDSIQFTFKDVKYTSNRLTVGNFIDFWKIVAATIGGHWLYLLGTASGDKAIKMAKMKVFIEIFVPEFKKNTMTQDISQLGVMDFLQFEEVFDSVITPWLQEWEVAMGGKQN